jgi:hypothetical protein
MRNHELHIIPSARTRADEQQSRCRIPRDRNFTPFEALLFSLTLSALMWAGIIEFISWLCRL